MVVFERDEPAGVVEDGGELAVTASLAAQADPRVARAEVLLDVAQLLVQAFLRADELRGLTPEQLAGDGAALGPRMRGARTGEAEVERHDVQ